MPDFDTTGPSHAAAPPEPTPAAPDAAVPGRRTAQPALTSSPTRGVEIAPDRRDHAVPPALRAEVDTELRTLIAHVERNVEQFSLASTQPDREAALTQLDTRVELALLNVPADLHAKLRSELIAMLGERHAAVARVLASADQAHGVRAARFFGVQVGSSGTVTTPVQRFATTTRGAVDVQAHAARGLTAPASVLPHHDAIQKAFGHHDVGGVRAHVGGVAADAAGAIGASAYATGDEIAFAADPDLRLAAHEAAHVVQQRGGVQVAGGVGSAGDAYEQHADQVAELVVRGENAEALLDELAHRGSAGGRAVQRNPGPTPVVPAAIAQPQVDLFNREFAAQLHVLGHPIEATSAQTDPHAASGEALTGREIAALFTLAQLTPVLQFCVDHVIPDHLFDGGQRSPLDAQQRIILSSHILSVGTYRAGAIDQRVHARMCGHWAELVIAYAGASEGGPGIEQDTDHTGQLELTVVDDAAGAPVSGEDHHTTGGVTTRATGTDMDAAFDQAGLPFERYAELRPGDWIYIFNNNGTGGGNHSLIFSRWAGPADTVQHGHVTVNFRPAFAASQRDPDYGGAEELIYLGDHFIRSFRGSQITPLTLFNHVSPTARPVHDAADVSAMLGTGDVSVRNQQFAEQHGAHRCNWGALERDVQARNAALIESLGARLDATQRAALTTANATPPGDTPIARVADVVRINERLRSFDHQATLLADGIAREHGSGEHRSVPYTEMETRSAADITTRDEAQAAVTTARAQRDEVRARYADLPAIAEVDAAVATVEQLEHPAAFARGARRQTQMQGQLDRARRQLVQMRRDDREHAELYTAELAYLDALGTAERASAQVELHDYHLVATAVGGAAFQGTTGAIPVTGLVENLVPPPDWASLALHAE